MVTLGGLAILRYRHLDAPLFDLAVGLVLAVAFYLFFGQGQGHGWGYRYLHPYFGNLVLLAVAGYRMIEGGSPVRAVKLQRLLVASTLLAVLVQIPFRLWEVREFTMPFASAYRYLKSLPVDVVIIKEQDTWYARDLVRNSPDAGTRPKIMSMERLSGQDARQLAARYKVQFVDHAQLSQLVSSKSSLGTMESPSLCILIPCLNEQESISAVVAEYRNVFGDARILVVDNGSVHQTAALAREAGATVLSEPRRGKARAILTAFQKIPDDLVLMVDGDGSYPADSARLIYEDYLRSPVDMLSGIRRSEANQDGVFRPMHQAGTAIFNGAPAWPSVCARRTCSRPQTFLAPVLHECAGAFERL